MRTLDRSGTRPQLVAEPRPAVGPAECCIGGCDAEANDYHYTIRAHADGFDVQDLPVRPPGGIVFQSPKLRFCDTHADSFIDCEPDDMLIEFR